jgi:chitosanase
VYRMDAFQRRIELDQWGLELPLVVRGQEISTLTLNATPIGCYDGPQPGTRSLAVQTPLARGLDVRLVQLGLSAAGADIKADGVFGRNSADHVRAYQIANGMPGMGVADVALIAQLAA